MPTDNRDPETARIVRRLRLFGLIAGVAAVATVGWGVFSRAKAVGDEKTWAEQRSVPVVRTFAPKTSAAAEGLELPGQLQAYNDAPIYARVPGYLKSWNEDIGAKVKAGQLLAVIDAPELDQELAQAQANLATVEANLKLSKVTAQRFQDLVGDDAVSKQDADEKSGDLAAKTAAVKASEANVQRLQALESFKRIVSPFDGVVTQRNANIGALVNAGAGANPGSALFNVSDVHLLRVYVHVPQSYSAEIKDGQKATLLLPQYANRSFAATVVSDAGAVSDQSGTLLVELEVQNLDGALKPGDFAQVRFDLPPATGVVRVPASALIFRSGGLQIATVTADGRAHLHTASVARDLGAQVELNGGVTANDKVIDTPPDSLEDGDLVRIAPPEPANPAGGARAQG
ncbi:MAG TPA: efflux RND transporter periplasmic adaptor subunit [Caulobacteraceae bacterium]|jgi:RND family efflux transporter MFP subunit